MTRQGMFSCVQSRLNCHVRLRRVATPTILLTKRTGPIRVSLVGHNFSALFGRRPICLILVSRSNGIYRITLASTGIGS